MLSSRTRARMLWWGACLLSIGPLACGGDKDECDGCHGLAGGDEATVPVHTAGHPAQPETWTPDNSLSYTLLSDDGVILEQSTTADAVDLTSGELSLVRSGDGGVGLRAQLTWPAWDAQDSETLPLTLVFCRDDGALLGETEPRTCSSGDVEILSLQGEFTRQLVTPDDTTHAAISLQVDDPHLELAARQGWIHQAAVAAVPDSSWCAYANDGYGD